MPRIYLNDDWDFCPEFNPAMIKSDCDADFSKVRLPHTFAVTPFNSFSTDIYQKDALYRRFFTTEPAWSGKRILLTVEGAAHKSEVYLNGKLLGSHECGYTAFTLDLTEALAPTGQKNLLAVRVDSHESLNQPPFGFVIDYMTYGGIYRDVYIDVKNPVYIEDVFVKTHGTEYEAEVSLAGGSGKITNILKAAPNVRFTTDPNSEIKLWSVEEPYLYVLETKLFDDEGNLLDSKETRFGFRDIRYDGGGCYL
ncbi:sugar-binding domain-containing protein, partial [Treponema sp.]|uniref:sugar-binding domain-containing protein n=1 Tax=Treponema sp. TaxID=166 RepID=UPI00345D3622|nr:glycoside hydrolase family 2 protein [Treponema sp.]